MLGVCFENAPCFCSGKIFPRGLVEETYKKEVESAVQKLKTLEADCGYGGDFSNATEPPS